MYVVRAGRLEAVDEGADVVIREYRRGDALGELALLTDSPRSASVRAARATEVIAVDQADFTGLLHSSPALSSALNRSLSRRLQDTRASASTARPRPTTVALIDARRPDPAVAARRPAGRRPAGSPVGRGARRCRRYRAQRCRVTRPPCTDRCSTGRRPAHDLVLLVGGSALHEPWTKFCLQQADRILAVTARRAGPAGARPAIPSCKAATWSRTTPRPAHSTAGRPRSIRPGRT